MPADDDILEKNPELTASWTPPSASDGIDDPHPVVRKYEAWLESLLAIAGLVVVIGFIGGFVIAFQAKVAPCENGHEFANGTTDFNCYAHPHAIVGGVLIGASVFAGLLLAIVGMGVKVIVAEIRARQATEAASEPAEGAGTLTEGSS